MTGWLAPLVSLCIVAATDVWVYIDAERSTEQGSPVFFNLGGLRIDTPVAWLISCVVLWILFFPMYVVSRFRA